MLTRGGRDWQTDDALAPEAGDLVVHRTRHNGLHRTAPGQQGRAGGIRPLLFTGIATPIWIERTVRNAFYANVVPIVVGVAVDHADPDCNRQEPLRAFEHVIGRVNDAARRLQALQPRPAGQR